MLRKVNRRQYPTPIGWADRIHAAEREDHGSGGSTQYSRLSEGCADSGLALCGICAGAPARRGAPTTHFVRLFKG